MSNPFHTKWNSSSDDSYNLESSIFNLKKYDGRQFQNRKTNKNFSDLLVCNGCVILSTIDGMVLRTKLDESIMDEIEFPHRGDDNIVNMFLSDDGHILLVCLNNGDNYVLTSKSIKPKKISKLVGLIECAAFDSYDHDQVVYKCLVGTNSGRIYELQFDVTGKERFCIQLFQLVKSRISFIYFHRFDSVDSNRKIFVVFASSNPIKLYYTISGPTFLKLFSDLSSSSNVSYTEFPGNPISSSLVQFMKYDNVARMLSFAVPTHSGIYSGFFKFLFTMNGDVDSSVEAQFIPYFTEIEKNSQVLSVVSSTYHFLVLKRDRLVALSLLSGELVQEILIKKDADGIPRKMIKDPISGLVWLVTDNNILQILISHEDRNTWSTYLKKAIDSGDESCFNKALSYSSDKFQISEVVQKQSRFYMHRKDFEKAAKCVLKAKLRFDESILILIEADSCRIKDEDGYQSLDSIGFESIRGVINQSNIQSIKLYIHELIKVMPSTFKSQKTMVSTWLVDIMLLQLSASTLGIQGLDITNSSVSSGVDVSSIKDIFREFKAYFDPITIFNLIISRNLRPLYLFYAQIIGDYDRVIIFYLMESRYMDVINILNDAPLDKMEDILYKVCPVLIEQEPESTIQMLLSKQNLRISRVLPSLTRYCSLLDIQRNSTTTPAFPLDIDFEGKRTNFAIKYLLEYLKSSNMDNLDSSIVSTLVSFLAKYDDENELGLVGFLDTLLNYTRNGNQIINLDKYFILRECKRWNRIKASVSVYLLLNMYEKAVSQAITFDIELAKSIAMESKPLKKSKQLLLQIARHFIKRDSVVDAIKLLNDSNGVMLIEDLLPYLPDFTEIDYFKQEICRTLEVSSERIESLKNEMNELSASSENIASELDNMKRRGYSSNTSQRCDYCQDRLFNRQFYLFPCSHGFHVECLLDKISSSLSNSKMSIIRGLEDQLKSLRSHRDMSDKRIIAQQELLQNELDGLIAADCPECGYLMIDSLSIPLVSSNNEEEAKSWMI